MQISDVIADMLTRIRNANDAKHETVDVPASNMKKAIAKILLDEGYIKSYDVVEDGKQGVIRITLKYMQGKQKVIKGLRRVSKPGLRISGFIFSSFAILVSTVGAIWLKTLRDCQ